EGKWLWPGYGDNSRILKWVFERCDGEGKAVETAIGYLPAEDAIDRTGTDVTAEDMHLLLTVDKAGWKTELETINEHFKKFDRLPAELEAQRKGLEERLG
ncbi:MAG: phosphoenolpyruvate carboxykinase (GTP), partial [Lentisphaeria bacterium]|nr:phosphoenolpyruvate carboxykinase (GTP) [Lentisphaeria bacterium]